MFEVELKFPVHDPQAAWAKLSALGALAGSPVAHCDCYFRHPSRNFAETDEALRLRSVGETNILCYKGPVIDDRTMMRQEIEVRVEPGASGVQRLTALLQQLGFRPVCEVRKSRRFGSIVWQDTIIGWTWDDVPPLGTFVELELVVEEQGRAAARDTLCRLADALQLGPSERRSYLELLLEHEGVRYV